MVTVIMPAYNAADTIVDAAESILAEPIDGLELLVIDDGSTDGGGELVAAAGDRRIRVIRQDNAGLVAALNTGLDAATGEFIARMDADDLSVPGRIARQLAWLRAHDDAVACGTDYTLFEAMTGRVRMPRSDRACRQRLLMGSCHCGASLVARRSVIEDANLRFDPDFAHAEDYEFITRLAGHGRLGNLPIVGYHYRVHATQVSARHAEAQHRAHLRIARRFADAAGAAPVADDDLRALLWPDRGGDVRARAASGWLAVRAAARVVRRRPGVQTARFTGRKVIEAAARR
ncbi:glycosyltransferase family 2 protein [Gordonia sp. FQ]|uniref:glycosyltransferase family 2 protein n=1 Tax=Gordonia sp. FQ TaxID=3446634 RepID=UPI003F87CF5B